MTEEKAPRKRPIGGAKAYVLRRMRDNGNAWHRTCGWRYESSGVTLQILQNLEVDGLVSPREKEGYRDAYVLTREGMQRARTL